MARSMMLMGVAALLSGCVVGPDFHPPRAYVPEGWVLPATQPAAGASVPTTRPAQVERWWRQFNDPVLTKLVEQAVASNLDVRLAEARIREARAARGIASAGLWPSVQAFGQYSRGQRGEFPAQDLFRTGLDAAWELDVFGGTRRAVEAAEAGIAVAVEDRRDVLVTLAAEVALNYIDLRSAQLRLAIARRNLAAQERTADLTRQRKAGGFAAGLDVANAEADAATTRAAIPTLETALYQAIYSLSVLLGREPTALEEELLAEKPLPPAPPRVPVGLPSELLRRRPDIRRAAAEVHRATANIGMAEADLYPRFSLTGSLGLEAGKLAALPNWSSKFWSIGPTATWQIFDAGRIRANIAVQNAVQEQTLLAYERTILTALQEVQTALQAYVREQQRAESLAAATAANRRALDLAMRLYTAGQTDFLNVLTAQRSLFLTEEATALSQRNVAADLIALYKALGGGWEEMAEAAGAR